MEIPELEKTIPIGPYSLHTIYNARRSFNGLLDPIMLKIYNLEHTHPINNQILIKMLIIEGLEFKEIDKPYSTLTGSGDHCCYKDSLVSKVSKRLMDYGVPKLSNCSILELLNMPIYEMEELYLIAFEVHKAKSVTPPPKPE